MTSTENGEERSPAVGFRFEGLMDGRTETGREKLRFEHSGASVVTGFSAQFFTVCEGFLQQRGEDSRFGDS